VLICLYAALASSLDLVLGHTGLLSVAQAAFFGIGAYSSALVTVRLGASFVTGVSVGGAVAAATAALIGVVAGRLREDYFAIATLGFQFILFGVFNDWTGLTRGPLGIPGIPRPSVLGLTARSELDFAILAVAFAVTVLVVIGRITGGPFGRVLHAIREDEVFAQSLGKNTVRSKLLAFAISAVIAAIAGSLYAHYITFVDPSSFGVEQSILVVSMVVIGGAGSVFGPPLGACALVLLPEVLRFAGFPESVAAHVRQATYGTLLVVAMIVRPKGLVGTYALSRHR